MEQNAALKGMGCTIVAAWIDDLGIRWTSVGDSLLLLYRLPDVIRLNADHSLGSFLDEQARQNKITRSEARRNRNRNALRSALTGSKIELIDMRGEPLELRAGDWVLLASDGICSLPGDEIADVVYRFRQCYARGDGGGAARRRQAEGRSSTRTTPPWWPCASMPADDVATRVRSPRPKGEEVDLRTRRIGVSRRGPAGPRSGSEDARGRRVAGCGRRAHVLRRGAHSRGAVAAPVGTHCGPAGYTTGPADDGTHQGGRRSGARHDRSGTRSGCSGQAIASQGGRRAARPDLAARDLAGQSARQQRGPGGRCATRLAGQVCRDPPPAGEREEGATSRSAASKPTASQPVPPLPVRAEEGASKPPAAQPAVKRAAPKTAATPPGKPATAGDSPAPRASKELSRAKPEQSVLGPESERDRPRSEPLQQHLPAVSAGGTGRCARGWRQGTGS